MNRFKESLITGAYTGPTTEMADTIRDEAKGDGAFDPLAIAREFGGAQTWADAADYWQDRARSHAIAGRSDLWAIAYDAMNACALRAGRGEGNV